MRGWDGRGNGLWVLGGVLLVFALFWWVGSRWADRWVVVEAAVVGGGGVSSVTSLTPTTPVFVGERSSVVFEESDAAVLPLSESVAMGRGQADLEVGVVWQTGVAVKGERLVWDVVVENRAEFAVSGVVLRIEIARDLVDVRVTRRGWDCDYAPSLKVMVCRVDRLAGGEVVGLGLSALVPSRSGAERFSFVAQVESGMPDPDLQNNRVETAVVVGRALWFDPPSGRLFAHVTQFGLGEEGHLEGDYGGDEWLTGMLQVPFGLGFGYHGERPPLLCLSGERPCPVEQQVRGDVLVASYEIQRVVRLGEVEKVVFEGEMGVDLHRYAAAVPSDCVWGGCVGYGLYGASGFEWGAEDLVAVYSFTKGGRAVDCVPERCVVIAEGEPGYYRIEAVVEVVVFYEGFPEMTREYRLAGRGMLRLVAPFVGGGDRDGG